MLAQERLLTSVWVERNTVRDDHDASIPGCFPSTDSVGHLHVIEGALVLGQLSVAYSAEDAVKPVTPEGADRTLMLAAVERPLKGGPALDVAERASLNA